MENKEIESKEFSLSDVIARFAYLEEQKKRLENNLPPFNTINVEIVEKIKECMMMEIKQIKELLKKETKLKPSE